MYEDNILLGIALFSIHITTIENIAAFFKLGSNSYNILLAQYGNILMHPISRYLGYSSNLGFLNPIDDSENSYSSKIAHTPISKISDVLYIDSIGPFKCPNSFTLSYHLSNNFRLLTIIPNGIQPFSIKTLFRTFIPYTLLILLLFIFTLMIIINNTLKDLNIISRAIAKFDKYDPYN